MAITDLFVLPEDVLLIPVAELPPAVRDKLDCKEGDLAITRPNIRAPSKVVSGQAADLLRRFQKPQKIVAAVLDYCQSARADPNEVLESALPLLRHLIDSNVLIGADSEQLRMVPTLSSGQTFGGFEIRQVVQIVEDTEVFLARSLAGGDDVALKITRPGSQLDMAPMFEREAVVLTHLDGTCSPHLVESGAIDGRHFIATRWKFGVPVTQAAAELRQPSEPSANRDSEAAAHSERLHRLVIALVEAYARLHERGIIHSDVHPSNLLADVDGAITIVDFGYARFADATHALSSAPRAGVGLYFEPECAQAMVAGAPQHLSSLAGEQYSVATIAFEMLTGATPIDFSPKYEQTVRQIAEAAPRPWAQLKVAAWPAMEEVLKTALSLDPRRRFSSLREFADRLKALTLPPSGQEQTDADCDQAPPGPALVERGTHEGFIRRVLERFDPDRELFGEPIGEGHSLVVASANHGAAGVAYGLLRLACGRDDAALLSAADLWISKTLAEANNESTFYNVKLEITKETVSPISLHHMIAGVHFVRALVSRAMADPMTEQGAIESFLRAADGEPESIDLTLGRMSVLHGCALLLDSGGGLSPTIDATPIVEFGDRVMNGIWERLDAFEPVARSSDLTYQGIAHGWAGVLYGTLRWSRVSERWRQAKSAVPLPQTLPRRLHELADCGTPIGRGTVWRWYNERNDGDEGDPGLMPGWCNGNAGHVHLWTAAYESYGEPRYLDLARRAAMGAWEQPVHFNNICCGAAGCAYAMLNLYRATGDKQWLDRARHYGHRVATHPDRPPDNPGDIHSLYKGDVGAMILLDDLDDPDRARMPLFE